MTLARRLRMTAAPSGAPTPTPPLTDLAGWWDATDPATITGNPVTTWADKIGSNDITWTTGPATGTRTQNGLNVLDFSGSEDGTFTTPIPMGSTTERTLIAAVIFDGGGAKMLFGTDGDSTPFLGFNGSTPYGRTAAVVVSSPNSGPDVFLAAHYRQTVNTLEVGYNDGAKGSGSGTTLRSWDVFNRYGGGLALDGAVGCILDYDVALSDSALTDAVAYITTLFGIP